MSSLRHDDDVFVESMSNTKFAPGEVVMVLGDGADWCHELPPLHRAKIIEEIHANPNINGYPAYLMDGKNCTLGYKVKKAPCPCGECPSEHIWDVALIDLGKIYEPVTEEELEEAYKSLGVREGPDGRTQD